MRWRDLAFGSVLGVSLGLNVWLLANTFRAIAQPAPSKEWIGKRVGPLEVRDASGARVRLQFENGQRPTVIYVFRATCPWCDRNEPLFRSLMERRSSEYRFLHLSTIPLTQPDAIEGAETYSLEPETLKALSLGSTPETIVVDVDGVIRARWVGAYFGSVGRDVSSFFGISLPTALPD